MKLTFGTHKEPNKVHVADFTSWEECWNAMNSYLDKEGLDSDAYRRTVGLDDHSCMIDFGSWTEFFYVDASFEDFMRLHDEDIKLKGDDPRRGRQL